MGAGFGAEVDEVVGFGDDIEVVLNDNDRVAVIDEAVEQSDQLGDVGHVQADGRFFDGVEVADTVLAGGGLQARGFGTADAAGELGHQLDALGFAAGETGAGLAKGEVVQAGVAHQFERAVDGGVAGKKVGRLFDGHVHDLTDVLAVVFDFQSGGVVAFFPAFHTGDVRSGKETHLEFDAAVAFAGLAAPAFGVERKTAGGVAPCAGVGQLGKQFADVVEKFDVGGGGGSRCFPDRGLVDFVNRGDVSRHSGDGLDVGIVFFSFAVEGIFHRGQENAPHEGGLAGTGNAGDDSEPGERDLSIQAVDVVKGGALDFQPALVAALGGEFAAFASEGMGGRIPKGNGCRGLGEGLFLGCGQPFFSE